MRNPDESPCQKLTHDSALTPTRCHKNAAGDQVQAIDWQRATCQGGDASLRPFVLKAGRPEMMRSPEHLRQRALDCLNLSKSVRSEAERTMLEDMAAEMSASAARIEIDRRSDVQTQDTFDETQIFWRSINKSGCPRGRQERIGQRMANATSRRFRQRARECRRIADEVREPSWLKALLALAKDLEDEADKIDAEQGPS
jgi:hypothetical protein